VIIMDQQRFREQLFVVAEGKDHWAWPAFTAGLMRKNRLHHLFANRDQISTNQQT